MPSQVFMMDFRVTTKDTNFKKFGRCWKRWI